jgi:hypothetical protein
MDWLEAVALFWFAAAIYFGGYEHDVAGGSGFRQFVGLIATFVIFLVVWRVVETVFGMDNVVGILVASAVAGLAIPLEARLGFLLVGGRVTHPVGH